MRDYSFNVVISLNISMSCVHFAPSVVQHGRVSLHFVSWGYFSCQSFIPLVFSVFFDEAGQCDPDRTKPAVSCSSSSVGSRARGTISTWGLTSRDDLSWSWMMSERRGTGGGTKSSVDDSWGGGLPGNTMVSRACRLSYMGLVKLVGDVGSWSEPDAASETWGRQSDVHRSH